MSDTKHTPGPWEVDSQNDDLRDVMTCAMDDGCRELIAVAYPMGPHDGGSESIGISNARLIAAAPDLLAALKVVLRFGEIPDQYRGEAYAAIAKAEGRQ